MLADFDNMKNEVKNLKETLIPGFQKSLRSCLEDIIKLKNNSKAAKTAEKVKEETFEEPESGEKFVFQSEFDETISQITKFIQDNVLYNSLNYLK